MRNATRVGNAYVAVTADGSGINDDIKEAFDGSSADVDKAGKKAGKDYGDGFDDEFGKRMDAIGDRIGENLSKRLSRSLSGSLTRAFNKTGPDSIGGRIGDAIGAAVGDRLQSEVGEILDRIDKANAAGGGGGVSGNSKAGSQNADAKQVLYKSYDFATLFEASRLKMREESNAAIAKSDAALEKSQQALYNRLEREHTQQAIKDDNALWRVRRAGATAHAKFLAALEKGSIDKNGNDIPGGSRSADRGLGLIVGGLLGAGSRNNGLNLIGKSIGGIVTMMEKLGGSIKAPIAAFTKGFSQASEAASRAGESISLFQKSSAGAAAAGQAIGASLSSVAVAGPAAGVALLAVVGAMSLMVSVAGALLAILTALVATIASALAGAALVAAGALGALAVAGGLVAVAFTSMTTAQSDALKADFKPLKAELTGIGQLMITQMIPYFSTWSTNLQNALLLIAPLANVMGDAFGRAGNIITQSLSGPGFQIFTQQLGVFLPSIVTRLSTALGGFLNGAVGVFAALLPSVNQFAGYLQTVAERFSAFATSVAGQNSIKDFVDRAVVSLKSLWNFTREVFGFIFDLLFAPDAQNAGNSIFDSLAKSFRGFRDAIARAQANGDLKKWLQDGIEFGKSLKKVFAAIAETLQKLYDAGVLDAIGDSLVQAADIIKDINKVLGPFVDFIGYALPKAVALATAPLQALIGTIGSLQGAMEALGIGGSVNGVGTATNTFTKSGYQYAAAIGPGLVGSATPPPAKPFTVKGLVDSGTDALNQTYESNGGTVPDPKKAVAEYVNPYIAFANSLIAKAPSVAEKMREAMKDLNKQIKSALSDAVVGTDGAAVADSLSSVVDSVRDAGKNGVEDAQSALSSAAESLASASSVEAAKKALKEVKRAQRGVKAALAAQVRINNAAKIVANQKVVTESSVLNILAGVKSNNYTLAEYAEARGRLAEKLVAANQKLADAISTRDNYNSQVTEGLKAFGSLVSAQAKTVNGVAQALTAGDITSNLQDRLAKIQKFRADLNILLAQGLSNAAYKQLVDAGVENGSAYAEALVAGGSGAVDQVNALTNAIGTVAGTLGTEASSRLYQAGVDAAQGLVDGLMSLSTELDSAAAALGNAIAAAVKRALGIQSPSTVMIGAMVNVGDGIVEGLKRQYTKVDSASAALASHVAIAPSLSARYAAGNVPASLVSGNSGDPRFRDLIVQTPTADPEGVAREVLNEVTGRL